MKISSVLLILILAASATSYSANNENRSFTLVATELICQSTIKGLPTNKGKSLGLGMWLRQQRALKHLSQETLERWAGVSTNLTSRIETGRSLTTFDNIALLSYALGNQNVEEAFKAFALGVAKKENEGTIPLSYEALSQPNLGAWLNFRRESQGLTMVELAEKAGIHYTTISRLESETAGQRASGFTENPRPEIIVSLARALNASVYEPFLVISKKYMRSNLEVFPEDIHLVQDLSVPDHDLSFSAKVARIENRRANEIKADHAKLAADELEKFLWSLDRRNQRPRMVVPQDGQVYQIVVENIDNPAFFNALQSPAARYIVKRYLNSNPSTAQMDSFKRHGRRLNVFIESLKARGERPRMPMQLVDGAYLYNTVLRNAHKPLFQEALSADALIIVKAFLKHLHLRRLIFPTLTITERSKVKRIAKIVFSKADLSTAQKAGRLFNSFVKQLTQAGLRPQMLPFDINNKIYSRIYHCIERPEFGNALTDPTAIEIRNKYIEKLKLLKILRGDPS